MPNIRNSILATLTYYGLFEMPLTLLEIYKYFINPGRLAKFTRLDFPEGNSGGLTEGVGTISLNDIAEELEHLVKIGLAYEWNGFYSLHPECARWYERRIEREKISAQKWKKLLRIARWFQAVPYVRAIMVSGSLAVSNAGPKSDFDVLIVMKSGRLYTGRILLSAMASLFGARRTKDDKVAPDKFCFNHYITDSHLHIEYQSLYNAQTYVNLRPIIAKGDVILQFYRKNTWLNAYVYTFNPHQQAIRRSVMQNRVLHAIAWVGESILNTRIGEWIESKFKTYQQNRIRNNPVTYESGGRTVFNDSQLEFHPHSAEAGLIDRYNKNLRAMGIIQYEEEEDSGLTKYVK